MNYGVIKKQLLIALRGGLSGKALSTKLGFSFNQVHRWESGEKQLRWDEFVHLCKTLDAPLEAAAGRLLFLDPATSPTLTSNFIGHLRARFPLSTIEDLARRLNCHASVMKRYVRGEIYPDLEVVLAMIDLNNDWLGHFLLELLPEESNPEFRADFAEQQRVALATLQEPVAQAVDACLVLKNYLDLPSHNDAHIADQIGLAPDDVKQIIERRVEQGILKKLDDGKYAPTYEMMNTTNSDPQSAAFTLRYWNMRAIDRIGQGEFLSRGAVKSVSAYRVCAMSKETMKRSNEILLRAYHEIMTVLEQDKETPEEVRILLMHSYSSLDLPEHMRPISTQELKRSTTSGGAQSFSHRAEEFA